MPKAGKRAPAAKLLTAANMPELYHTMPGKDFDPEESEVLQWIAKQPELLLWLFDAIRAKGLIVFDQDAKTWSGGKLTRKEAAKAAKAIRAKTTKSRTPRRAARP